MNRDEALAAIAAIHDPSRRALYELVAGSTEPISRDRAAAGLGLPRSTAAFHLDHLVAAGLLRAEHRRLSGRTGPGAGRPAKVYSRAIDEIAVSVPARRYDLMAELFATALDETARAPRAARAGTVRDTVRRVAEEEGVAARHAAESLDALLGEIGYEPRTEEGGITLANCPFQRLAERHGRFVCDANHAFLCGAVIADGGDPARVLPRSGTEGCCARIAS